MLRDFHQPIRDLTEVRDTQQVNMGPESLSFDIRLDATDQLNDGDPLAAMFGIAPRLATLELMMEPKSESLMGKAIDIARQALGVGGSTAFSFTGTTKPPLVLFIWGPTRVLPVNIDSLEITESEFSPTLVPTRATVTVNLTVIEGENPLYKYTKAIREQMSLLNLANAPDITDVIIPG